MVKPVHPTPSVHQFIPSDVPVDHRGIAYCGREGCGLPQYKPSGVIHPVHDYQGPVDDSARIIGEGGEDAG